MRMVLSRLAQTTKETLGLLHVYDGLVLLKTFAILEPAWKNNENNISCIPEETYTVKHRYSEKFGEHFIICDVSGRELILIHFGNYFSDTAGCLLIGNSHADINGDGQYDVLKSKTALSTLVALVPGDCTLTVVNAF